MRGDILGFHGCKGLEIGELHVVEKWHREARNGDPVPFGFDPAKGQGNGETAKGRDGEPGGLPPWQPDRGLDAVGLGWIGLDCRFRGNLDCGGRVRGVGANSDAAFVGKKHADGRETSGPKRCRAPFTPLPPQSILPWVALGPWDLQGRRLDPV